MNLYENLVNQSQMIYSQHYNVYATGRSPYELSTKPKPNYQEQIAYFVKEVQEADCIIIGGASGLSASGGGDFYYENNDSYKKYFKKFEEEYHFDGAFAGMMHQFETREEHWGYLATFLHTTQTSPVRKPYLYLNEILKEKDFYILTTNQDTQFLRLYNEDKVSQIQGDHRFFQCSKQCSDETWDALEPVSKMIAAMGDSRKVPSDLIPRCPHCGEEMFPWVRGYGNFLQGTKYHQEYKKISDYIQNHSNKKILLIELGVGRMTPMFIQEPFWNLTLSLPNAHYISVNDKYDFLPKQIEDKGMSIVSDIAQVLNDVKKQLKAEVNNESI